jgi:hypothetical protein
MYLQGQQLLQPKDDRAEQNDDPSVPLKLKRLSFLRPQIQHFPDDVDHRWMKI